MQALPILQNERLSRSMPLRPDGDGPVALFANGQHARFDEGLFWQRLSDYENVPEPEFLSAAFQTKHSLSNASPVGRAKLIEFIGRHAGPDFANDVLSGLSRAPMAVQLTPYILSLINWRDPAHCPIRTQFLPLASRLEANHPMVGLDSLSEKGDTKAPGLVHRYYDRVLFLPQSTCPVYCRFCTRSYAIGHDTETVNKFKLGGTPQHWQEAFAYLHATPEVEDVVVSGGDCYNLHPAIIGLIAKNLLAIEHIRRVRIATKGLAVNPGKVLSDKRWTEAVMNFALLGRQRGKQVVVHTHVNSPEEITWITREAAQVFFEAGVVMRNQSVLLRGVNDSVQRMALLIKRLSYLHIQPYYVYQHDLVQGVDDLRTSLAHGLAIEHGVRGITAGFNTPQFVVDAPGGGGKRIASTYDFYDPETGVSVYTAPAVKPGATFLYFDPLHALDPAIAKRWSDPAYQADVCNRARAYIGRGLTH